MKVIATRLGYYGNLRRKPGTVFVLSDEKHFTKSWMEKAPESAAVPKPSKTSEVKSKDKTQEVI